MKLKLLFLLLLTALLGFAQNPTNVVNTFGIHPGFSYIINTTVVQPDGKIIVGGNFSQFQGNTENNLVRINADGSKDISFRTFDKFRESRVNCIALQTDGKILVGHRGGLVRLNSSGIQDPSFNTGTGFSGTTNNINSIILQPDGKIIAIGDFSRYQGIYEDHVIRLNPDGSKDTSFNVGILFKGNVAPELYSMVLQTDGKIIIGGQFEGSPTNLIRLNADGSMDNSFKTSFVLCTIYSVTIQTDGKILVGGDFSNYEGTNMLIRLNSDGSKDSSFNTGTGFNNDVYSIAIQSDGKIIVGGDFNYYKGDAQESLIRLNGDGSKDTSFNIGTGPDSDIIEKYLIKVQSLTLQPDGKIITGGLFTEYQENSKFYLARINPDGSNDNSFDQGSGLNNTVFAIASQRDEKFIAAGSFTSYNGITQNRIIRFNSDGTKDTSFNIGNGFDNTVNCLVIQPDDKIIIGGNSGLLVRRNPDGTLDRSFGRLAFGSSSSTYFEIYIKAIALQPDGRIIVGGNFGRYGGLSQEYLVRLNSDGSKDDSFNIGKGFDRTVKSIVVQPDGKIIVGGAFTYYQGSSANYLIRLNSDGSKDTSFNIGIDKYFGYINSVAMQADGKIIVGGTSKMARLNSDGSIDTSFNTGIGFYRNESDAIESIVLQKDSKIIVGGYFTSYQGVEQNRLIRLNSDGSKDSTFEIGTGFQKSGYYSGSDYGINSIDLKVNGEILVGGNYTLFNGQKSAYLVNLKGDFTPISIDATTTQTNLTCPDSSTGSASIVSVYNGKAPYAYLWSNGATTPTITGLAVGNYSCTITDADSSKITKNFIIIEYNDLQKPTIIAPATLTVNTNGNCTATGVVLVTPVTTDNCSVTSVTNDAPIIFPLGWTLVTWTAKDANNNTATATQIVIVQDITKPTIMAPAALTVNINTNCTATGVLLGTPVTADNCRVSSVTNNAPTAFPIGNTIVTWTVKDANYNTATATQIVTVKDIIKPTITAPADKIINITSNCTVGGVFLGTPTTADNCSVSSVTNNAPSTYPLGNTTVTWTVKDANNNTATATQIVTVTDVTKPTITAPPTVIVNADSNGTASGVLLGTPVTADNCSVTSVTNNAPTTFPLGNTTVIWTVKDGSNNTATATQIIIVKNATPTTLIPDANFEKKLIALGIDSGTTDGRVLTSSISSLTSLDVSNSLIANLTGIQDFVGLTNLNCYNNQLTNIDVTKNIALTNLNCGLNQLASLDISKNTALTYLTCTNMQKLTTLDVSKNVALLDLYCYNNQLTTLDVSQNVLLLTLQCSGNRISVLDVSKNVALKTLTCNSNQLTSLDVSKNTSLTGLNCNSNQLINLDLRNGNNTILSNSKASNFANNPNLTCIQVDNITYSNANWTTLKDVKASYNTSCTAQQYTLIPDLNFEKKLIALGIDSGATDGKVLTSSISSLTSLDVSWSSITDLTGIQDFVGLTNLNCSNNQLTNLNVSKNVTLTNLNCSYNKLITLDHPNGIITLDVSKNVALTSLHCNSNQLTSLDVSKNTLLTDLDCSNNSLQNLNVSNGNNTKMLNVNFKSNSSLSCIKVDDEVYSNANWAGAKDATAIYSKTTCTLGIEDLVSDKISIYPNPVKGQLHIDNIVLEKVTVYDASGKLIKTIPFTNTSNSNTIDFSGLTEGVYFIYLESQGTKSARKIIVE